MDGRGCEDYRCVEVETDVVSNTSGSARVKLGHTDILVGVKAEMGTPKLEKPNEGYLEFFVDCSANATPEFEGRGGDDLGTEIANTLYRIFNNKSSVDLKSLCISPREHCWILYVDVLLLECGGNLFDAISIAVKAALFNTRPLTVVASPVVEHRLRTRRLSGHGSRAQLLRGMWDLPGPGHEPTTPASAGGLSTTAPPGKPSISCFTALHFIVLSRYCVFYKLKVCDNAALSKSISAIFPAVFSHFMSLCHILIILAIFWTFSLFIYLLW
nr:exosome complex component RRP42 isoform X3 [Globicephala melas]